MNFLKKAMLAGAAAGMLSTAEAQIQTPAHMPSNRTTVAVQAQFGPQWVNPGYFPNGFNRAFFSTNRFSLQFSYFNGVPMMGYYGAGGFNPLFGVGYLPLMRTWGYNPYGMGVPAGFAPGIEPQPREPKPAKEKPVKPTSADAYEEVERFLNDNGASYITQWRDGYKGITFSFLVMKKNTGGDEPDRPDLTNVLVIDIVNGVSGNEKKAVTSGKNPNPQEKRRYVETKLKMPYILVDMKRVKTDYNLDFIYTGLQREALPVMRPDLYVGRHIRYGDSVMDQGDDGSVNVRTTGNGRKK